MKSSTKPKRIIKNWQGQASRKMISLLKTSLTLLILSACFVKNGISLADEDTYTGKWNNFYN